ncbi:methyltransferase domain-containing protein [Planotetraspora phitsanulokensis]|uniref:SAM-dependent methyltransferase n=1 Tax=Planotetraspora phitsanulokensis TaxID=575192 RepID=A0A8J3XE70_9ACTN|nr:methyltransferase domain-containing protein [Planotetraspora phitsanulokensis]GII38152.1 SAM-dependent methyltransferase [Planotetraspora phitsanulokensis]
MLADVIDLLLCPVCGGRLTLAPGTVRCDGGHAFDVARQGYVSLLTGSAAPGTADTPAMVAARADFLDGGHFAPLADAVAAACGAAEVIADAGAGTGHYLSRALDAAAAGAVGLALDVSKHALRRAARAHPRIGAVVADVWRPLPVRDASADVLLNVFAPRNAAEFARILKPGGTLVVVTPAAGHLRPLVDRLGLLSVDADKERRLGETLAGRFDPVAQDDLEIPLALGHEAVEAVVRMGPSAWHTEGDALAKKIGELPDPVHVTASFRLTTWVVRK